MRAIEPQYVKLPAAVRRIYDAVAELEKQYPERKFTPDGHLVGSIGEVIAADAFRLKLLPPSSSGHDATDESGRLVQIKLTAGSKIGLNACCDRLIVLRMIDHGRAELVYDGDGRPVWEAAGKMQKNGQRPISISKIRKMGGSYLK